MSQLDGRKQNTYVCIQRYFVMLARVSKQATQFSTNVYVHAERVVYVHADQNADRNGSRSPECSFKSTVSRRQQKGQHACSEPRTVYLNSCLHMTMNFKIALLSVMNTR